MKLRQLLKPTSMGLGLSLLVLIFSLLSGSAQEPLLNQKIVNFCETNLDQKVGNGNCYALAHCALIDAGAKPKFDDYPGKGDYVWGYLVYYLERDETAVKSSGKIDSILPGDVIQFRDCRFAEKNWSQSFGHHTAVIVGVENGGKALKILQQNYNGKNVVTALTIHPMALEKGWFRIYQPLQATKKHK